MVLSSERSGGREDLCYEGLFETLRAYYHAHGVAYVVAPFIRADVLGMLLGERNEAVVLTSWRPDHLLAGASDLDVYPLCRERGWRLYTSDTLHAKLYSVDLKSAWLGSANVTRRALGLAGVGNDEVLGFVDPLPADVRRWVFGLLQAARPVTNELHVHYAAWLAEQAPPPRVVFPEDPSGERDFFRVDELPASVSPRRLWEVLQAPAAANPAERAAAERDLRVYRVPGSVADYDGFRTQLAAAFRAHPFVAALLVEVDANSGLEHARRPGLQFGRVRRWVRGRCTDKSSREEVTEHVDRLFAWCEALLGPEYEVVTPGEHTRVLRRCS